MFAKKRCATWLAMLLALSCVLGCTMPSLAETSPSPSPAPAESDVVIIEDDEVIVIEEEGGDEADAASGEAAVDKAGGKNPGFAYGVEEDKEEKDKTKLQPSKSVYLVSFLANDDTPYFICEIEENDKVPDPDFIPELEGYTFEYWFDIYAKDGEWKPYNFNRAVKKDLFLRAMFVRDALPEDMVDGELPEDNLIHEGGGVETHDVISFVLGLDYTITMDDQEIIIDENGNISYADEATEKDENAISITLVDNPEDEPAAEDTEAPSETPTAEPSESPADAPTAEPSESPSETPTAEPSAEPESAPTQEPSAEPAPEETRRPLPDLHNCKVEVFSSHNSSINEGGVIEVWGELTGFEGQNLAFQWQYSVGGGEWTDVKGATSLRYAFVATSETVNYNWRLMVEIVTDQEK